jgi:prevent-host-death family protein
MTQTMTVTDAKARLSELVAAVAMTHDHVEITRNGEPAAVLISVEELTALRETIAILSDPGYTFITERLPVNPHRLGGRPHAPYEHLHSAHLGTYRVVARGMRVSRSNPP